MSRKTQNHYDEDFEYDELEDTETLISRNKPPRYKSAPAKKTKKTGRRPGSPNKAKPKLGKDLWMTAIKKRQTLGIANGRHPDTPHHKTPIEFWVDTLRKTGVGMSTESSGNAMTGLKKGNDLNLAYLSTSHYMRQMMGTEKPRRNMDDPTAKAHAGTPAYKSPEEYYDDILDLKKHISSLSQDNSTMKAKVRRLEEDNIKKEKEIDGLLHPEKNEELRRTMGDRKPDTGAVIHSLKQKILKLEMQLRDKEASYVKLVSELKTTRVEEMKIQMEVLYQELLRLQNSHDTGADKSRSGKESGAKVKALNQTVLRLSKVNEQLQSENKGLKEDLEKALEETQEAPSGRREYEDMNKRQLLVAISKAERRAERAERKAEADNTSMLSLDSRRSEVQGKIVLHGSMEERLHQLDQRESELLDEIEKLKVKVRRLNNEMSKKSRDSSGTPRRRDSPTGVTPRRRRSSSIDSGRETNVQSFSQKKAAKSIQRQWRQHREKKREEEERLAIRVEEMRRTHAARTIQRRWTKHQGETERMHNVNKFRENHAAKAIQTRWRRHRQDEEEDEEAAYVIQSALRGHHQRRQKLKRYQDDDYDDEEEADYSTGSDDAVYLIQSSLKGHSARRQRMRKMRLDSTGDEDYDDEGHRGYTGQRYSGSRRPSSAHSRGSSVKKTYATYPNSRQASMDDDDDIIT
ncbi:IQ domain-containing protein E-like isoform X1 [Haliotis rufescens]|uniref:IQ domain-containing protein E-like isoform X1 n=1 Tax=Haliotis rufescens TaxID=6454 RepID=UPI001EAF9BAC|nr:IQ domain-containing protein E-like isoform X1 [Haliotis rufescens]